MMLPPTDRMLELYDMRDKARTQEEIDRINQLIIEEDEKDPRLIQARKIGFAC